MHSRKRKKEKQEVMILIKKKSMRMSYPKNVDPKLLDEIWKILLKPSLYIQEQLKDEPRRKKSANS